MTAGKPLALAALYTAAALSTLGSTGCDTLERKLGIAEASAAEEVAAPTMSVAIGVERHADIVVIETAPRTRVSLRPAEGSTARISPKEPIRTRHDGKAEFSVFGDGEIDLVAVAENRGGSTEQPVSLTIRRLPTLKLSPGVEPDETTHALVSCHPRTLELEGWHPGSLCPGGSKVAVRRKDMALTFEIAKLAPVQVRALTVGDTKVEATSQGPIAVQTDLLTAAGGTLLAGRAIEVPLALELVDGSTKTATLSLSLAEAIEPLRDAIEHGGLSFDDEPASNGDATLLLTSPIRAVGPGKTLADVDLIAVSKSRRRTVQKCRYTGGKTVERIAWDREVVVRDRRTGKTLGRKTFRAGKVPKCEGAVLSTSSSVLSSGISQTELDAWLESIRSQHSKA